MIKLIIRKELFTHSPFCPNKGHLLNDIKSITVKTRVGQDFDEREGEKKKELMSFEQSCYKEMKTKKNEED